MPEQTEKPVVQVTGENANVFVTLAICTKALKRDGQRDKATELANKVMKSGSYSEALSIMQEYCEFE